jgi:hypothetical protein
VLARAERGRAQVRERLADIATPILQSRGVDDPDGDIARLLAHLIMGNAEAGVALMLSDPKRWPPRKLGALLGRMVAPALGVVEQAVHEGDA